VGQKLVEPFFESGESFFSSEGFVVTVSSDDEVGFEVVEVLVEVAEVIGAGHEVDFVGRPGEVADGEFVIGVVLMKKSFEVAEAAFGV